VEANWPVGADLKKEMIKMKKLMLLILVIVLMHTSLFAKVVTAVAPLKPGNKWVYYSEVLFSGERETYEVTDSVKIINGIPFYFVLRSGYCALLNNGFYARYSTMMTDSLYKYFKVNPQKGDAWEQRRFVDTIALHSTIRDTFIAQVFNNNTTIYVIDRFRIVDGDTGYMVGSREFWTKEFGMLTGLFEQAESYLLGCVIDGVVYGDTSTVGVDEEEQLPTEFVLYQNYPNPFNATTNIKFSIAELGVRNAEYSNPHSLNQQFVTLKVYDVLGREVATIVEEVKEAGTHHYPFSIIHYPLPAGVYFYQLRVRNNSSNHLPIQTKKMLIMK
jgi:hypothetical protein